MRVVRAAGAKVRAQQFPKRLPKQVAPSPSSPQRPSQLITEDEPVVIGPPVVATRGMVVVLRAVVVAVVVMTLVVREVMVTDLISEGLRQGGGPG